MLHMKDELEFIYNCREKEKEKSRAYTRLVSIQYDSHLLERKLWLSKFSKNN